MSKKVSLSDRKEVMELLKILYGDDPKYETDSSSGESRAKNTRKVAFASPDTERVLPQE